MSEPPPTKAASFTDLPHSQPAVGVSQQGIIAILLLGATHFRVKMRPITQADAVGSNWVECMARTAASACPQPLSPVLMVRSSPATVRSLRPAVRERMGKHHVVYGE